MTIPSCPLCNKRRRVAHDRGPSGVVVVGSQHYNVFVVGSWHCNACKYTFGGPVARRPAGPGRTPRKGTLEAPCADPAVRQLLLRALRHAEATVGLGGRLRRYVVNEAPAKGAWADLASIVGAPVTKGGLSDAWCGRRPCRSILEAVRRWVEA